MGDRGQAWTFDALVMAGVMVFGLVFAAGLLPAGDRGSAADREEAQLRQDLADLLTMAEATGALGEAVRYWNDSSGTWHGAAATGHYSQLPPGHPLSGPVRAVLGGRGISYGIAVEFRTATGTVATQPMVVQGAPGPHGVAVSTPVVLYDDDILSIPRSSISLAHSLSYFAPDEFEESNKYAVVIVSIEAWTS